MFTLTARLAALALFGAIAAAAPASAEAGDPTQSMMVRHDDLDLGTAQGVAKLNHRIRAAATRVCGTYYPADLRARANVLGCRAGAMAAAASKVELAVAGARNTAVALNSVSAPAIVIP